MKFSSVAFGFFYFCGFSSNFCFPFSTTAEYLDSCGQEINVENLGTNLVNSLAQLRKIDSH